MADSVAAFVELLLIIDDAGIEEDRISAQAKQAVEGLTQGDYNAAAVTIDNVAETLQKIAGGLCGFAVLVSTGDQNSILRTFGITQALHIGTKDAIDDYRKRKSNEMES